MVIDPTLDRLIVELPKAELHVHIEGTLEPEAMFAMAARNGVTLPWSTLDEVRAAYDFTDLQSFLDVYYLGAAALVTSRDFDELMWAYLERAAADGVRHAEIFFDPQTHTHRGIGFDVFVPGFEAAMARAEERFGITSDLIMCFVRHLPPEDAMETLTAAVPHLGSILGVGLDSSEVGFPPEPWAAVYREARSHGLRAVAHAGEEGPPEYVRAALDVLEAERIDHGVRSLEDPSLVARLRDDRIPLTVCPLSNLRLKVVDEMAEHPMRRLMDEGLLVCVNSDDPAYFGGYVADNYRALVEGLGFGRREIVALARNSISASFLSDQRKTDLLAEIDDLAGYG
ncbi:MAG TPA: adenosine deaminase [Acidimicrobiia bacterium]|nr:adenosine deaminase [Acidimicrobiia bacterium]